MVSHELNDASGRHERWPFVITPFEDKSISRIDCKIRVIDYKTSEAVPHARVWLGEQDLGETCPRYGYVKAWGILTGVYFLKVIAPGYPLLDDAVTVHHDGREIRVELGVE